MPKINDMLNLVENVEKTYRVKPKKDSPNVITLCCNVLDGVGDVKHLLSFAPIIKQRFPDFKFALLIFIPASNMDAIQLLIENIPLLKDAFDFHHVFVRDNHYVVNTELDTMGRTQLQAIDVRALRNAKNEIFRGLDLIVDKNRIKEIAQQCILIINISTKLNFKEVHKSRPVIDLMLHENVLEAVLVQWFPAKCPLLSMNELGDSLQESPIVFLSYDDNGNPTLRQPGSNDNVKVIHNANMGIGRQHIGVRTYPDYAKPLTQQQKIQLIKENCVSQLRAHLLSAVQSETPRYIAVGYLKEEFMTVLFIAIQIRRAHTAGEKCDIYVSASHVNLPVLQKVLARLQNEFKLNEPIAKLAKDDELPSANIRVFLHPRYSTREVDVLWRLADYSLGAAGDDTYSRALSSAALPFVSFTHALKSSAVTDLVYRNWGVDFNGYIKAVSLIDPSMSASSLRGAFASERSRLVQQLDLIDLFAKRAVSHISDEAKQDWRTFRKRVLSTCDIRDKMYHILFAGLYLSAKNSVLQPDEDLDQVIQRFNRKEKERLDTMWKGMFDVKPVPTQANRRTQVSPLSNRHQHQFNLKDFLISFGALSIITPMFIDTSSTVVQFIAVSVMLAFVLDKYCRNEFSLNIGHVMPTTSLTF